MTGPPRRVDHGPCALRGQAIQVRPGQLTASDLTFRELISTPMRYHRLRTPKRWPFPRPGRRRSSFKRSGAWATALHDVSCRGRFPIDAYGWGIPLRGHVSPRIDAVAPRPASCCPSAPGGADRGGLDPFREGEALDFCSGHPPSTSRRSGRVRERFRSERIGST